MDHASPSSSAGDTTEPLTCPSCLELLRFPVTLSACRHSVCKACILNHVASQPAQKTPHPQHRHPHSSAGGGCAAVLFDCPVCSKITSFANESELKINVALQSAIDILRGDELPRIACMRCEAVEATVDCPECNAKLCSGCSDLVHVGKLKSHRATYNIHAVNTVTKPPHCSQLGHEQYRTDLFCVECKVMLCVVCSQCNPLHRNHVVVPLSEAAEVEKGKLRQTLDSAAAFRRELKSALMIVDAASQRISDESSSDMEQFDHMMRGLLLRLQEKRNALLEHAQLMREAELGKLRSCRRSIVSLAASLNGSMASSQRALVVDTSAAIIKSCVEMAAELTRAAPVIIPEVFTPHIHFQPAVSHMQQALDSGLSVALSQQPDTTAQIVEARSIFRHLMSGGPSSSPQHAVLADDEGSAPHVSSMPRNATASLQHQPPPLPSAFVRRETDERTGYGGQQQQQSSSSSSLFVPTGPTTATPPFWFTKSTYNELSISNRGLTVTSASGSQWETAMCGERLDHGVTYFEVVVNQYTPANGHNIVVGFVFDGPHELCEVLGENVHSVGCNLGRGTKCVGGDFFLPYVHPATTPPDEKSSTLFEAGASLVQQGDTIGCKIDYDAKQITYYKNGRSLGVAFTGLNRPSFAAVSLFDAQRVTLIHPMRTPL